MPQCERILPVRIAWSGRNPVCRIGGGEGRALVFAPPRRAAVASGFVREDTVVPRGELPALLRKVKALGREHGFRSVCYGHAGDGNLHVNILRDDLNETTWNHTLSVAIRELLKRWFIWVAP